MLSKNAQMIQDFLNKQEVETKVIELTESTHTALDSAKAIGCEVHQIVKSLIFRTKLTHKPILVLVSGPNRVNEKALETIVGEEIAKADATFVKEKTGFSIGGIPPIGHKEKIETYIDADLLQHEVIWAAAGTPNAIFSLKSAVIVQLTGGKVISVK